MTSLAKLSDSYASGHIHDTIVETLTERRLAKMSKHPLQASDFISGLTHHNSVHLEEEEALKVRAGNDRLNDNSHRSSSRVGGRKRHWERNMNDILKKWNQVKEMVKGKKIKKVAKVKAKKAKERKRNKFVLDFFFL